MEKIKNVVQKYYHLVCIAMIVVFRGFYIINGRGLGDTTGDSGSYINADLHLSALGKRVPIYPIFLKLCKRMTRWDVNMGCAVAAILQCIFSLAVLYFLFKILMMVTGNRLLSYITLTFYGCNVAILIWDCSIMTESLALDAVIIFLYLILKYLEKKNFWYGAGAVAMSVVSAMIKPTCAVLTGVCLALLILQFFFQKEIRKTVYKVGTVVLLAVLFYVAYCANTYRNYGTFNLTQLGPRHDLVTCLVTGTYKNYPDKELVAKIDEILQADIAEGKNIKRYPTTSAVMKLFGDEARPRNIAVIKFNKFCEKSDPVAHFKFKIQNIKDFWDADYESTNWQLWEDALTYNRVEKLMYKVQKYVFSNVHVRFSFIMLFICMIMTVVMWVAKKQVPWHYLGMTGTILILLFAVFNNAYASFYRHTVFVLPFAYPACAMVWIDLFKFVKGKLK